MANTQSVRAPDATITTLVVALVAIAAADVLNPQWSWVENMASHFVHGRAGWLITVAGVGLAVASTLVIRLASPHTDGARVGFVLLGVWAAGMLVAGIVPADPPGQWDRPPSGTAMVHGLGGIAAFAAFPVAALVLTAVWSRDDRWRGVVRPLVVTLIGLLAAFSVFAVTFVDVMGGPELAVGSFATVAGLAERIMIVANAAWLVVAAVGVRRMAGR